MIRNLVAAAFLSAAALASAAEAEHALSVPTGTKNAYIKHREMLVHSFTESTAPNMGGGPGESKALHELEEMLNREVAVLELAGFERTGINLESLVEHDHDYGLLDAIRYRAKKGEASYGSTVLVTSRDILNHYFEENKQLPKTIEAAIQSEELYSRGFFEDIGVTFVGDISVKANSGDNLAAAHLAFTAQDDEIVLPWCLFVALVKEDIVVLVFWYKLPEQIPEFAPCASIRKAWLAGDAMLTKTWNEENAEQVWGERERLYRTSLPQYVACQVKHYPESRAYRSAAIKAQQIIDEVEAGLVVGGRPNNSFQRTPLSGRL